MNRFVIWWFTVLSCAIGDVRADAVSADEAVVATNIKLLHDKSSQTRETAAAALRSIVSKYQSGTVNLRSKDRGESYWTAKVNGLKDGMTKAEVHRILPPFAAAREESSMAYGESNEIEMYRLDYHWLLDIQYRDHEKVIKSATLAPKIVRQAFVVHVEAPKNYTGIWLTWHVTGQKGYEIPYKGGKYDGVFVRYHDDGTKWWEQAYTDHGAHGPGAGWYRGGKRSYAIEYRNGKQHGQWVHWHENGKKRAETNYKDGVMDGLHANWYENGQMTFEQNYEDGKMHGIEAAWDKEGVLQYKREYENGKLVKVYPVRVSQ